LTTRRVLFVGGVADGTWHDVPADKTVYLMPVPLPATALYDALSVAEPVVSVLDVETYYVERFAVFGRTVWVATLGRIGRMPEDAVIRALFQPDVATEMLGGKR
jgi:hypothetical protein